MPKQSTILLHILEASTELEAETRLRHAMHDLAQEQNYEWSPRQTLGNLAKWIRWGLNGLNGKTEFDAEQVWNPVIEKMAREVSEDLSSI